MPATSLIRCSAVSSRTTSSRCPALAKVSRNFVWDDSGTYRVIYTARLADAVYVLHAFQKKTQTTAKRGVELARKRYTDLTRGAQ